MTTFLTLLLVAAAAAEVTMVVQYSTENNVTLSIMNITFRTVDLQVTVLGCDYGYYASGPACLECACDAALDSERAEAFG